MTTVAEWLAQREPPAPDALRKRVLDAIGDACAVDASETSNICRSAAERTLRTVLVDDSTSRESALDLLTADALITYAFEAAADAEADIARFATESMRRIATIGTADA